MKKEYTETLRNAVLKIQRELDSSNPKLLFYIFIY